MPGRWAWPKAGTIRKLADCKYCGRTLVWVGDILDGRWEHEEGDPRRCPDSEEAAR